MRIAIAGAGNVGRAIARELLENGHQVLLIDKDPKALKVDSVQVVWFLIEDLKWYPWEKFYGMMAADMKGPLMQESLDRLKYYMRSKK